MPEKCDHNPSARDGKCIHCGYRPKTREELAVRMEGAADHFEEYNNKAAAYVLRMYADIVREVM